MNFEDTHHPPSENFRSAKVLPSETPRVMVSLDADEPRQTMNIWIKGDGVAGGLRTKKYVVGDYIATVTIEPSRSVLERLVSFLRWW